MRVRRQSAPVFQAVVSLLWTIDPGTTDGCSEVTMNRNDKVITSFTMLSHALVHTYELTIPILMVVWATTFGYTQADLGVVVAIGYGLFGLGALPSGVLADRYGSHRLIAVCLAGMGLSFVALSFATSLAFIAIAIGLWGVAASIYHPAGLSLISTGVEERGTGFAFHGMAGNVGIAFGPLVAVVLLLFFDWQVVTFLLALPALFAIVVILNVDVDETAAIHSVPDGGRAASDDGASLRELLDSTKHLFLGGFLLVFLIMVFNGLYYRGILTFLPDILGEFVGQVPLETDSEVMSDQLQASDLVYVGLLMVGVLGQFVGGKATDRIRTETGLLFGYVALIVVALSFVPATRVGPAALVPVSVLLGFVLFMLQPLYQATVAEYSPADERGLSYGFTYLGQFGVGALGAAFVGVSLTYTTLSLTFLLLAAFGLVAAILSFVLSVRYR